MEKAPSVSPKIQSGMGYMFLSAFFFSLMGLMVRLLKDIPFMEIVIIRSGVSFVICVVMLVYAGKALLGKNKGFLLLRGLFGFMGLSAYFFTIQNMPLAEAVTIQYTNPLFTALFAPFILKEKSQGREWLASAIAFSGVVILAQPQSLSALFPAAVGLFGAMCSGIAYNIVRKLGMRGEDPLNIVLYFPLVAMVLGTPVASASWQSPSWMEWGLLLGVGITTQIAQVALTKGLRAERAAKATVMNYMVIGLSSVYSLILGERLTPWTFLGIGVIILAITVLNAPKRKH